MARAGTRILLSWSLAFGVAEYGELGVRRLDFGDGVW